MTVFDVFLSMRWEYKAISIVIWGVVGFTFYLTFKLLKKPKSKTIAVEESLVTEETQPFHPDDLLIKKEVEPITSVKQVMSTEQETTMRPYQREGIHGYTRRPRKGSELELHIQREAERLTKEEAWSELSESFWDTRREGLKQFYPEIYEEIRYWETHLDDYNTRIGMMWVFGIPLREHDLWVRRGGKESRVSGICASCGRKIDTLYRRGRLYYCMECLTQVPEEV